MRILLALWLLPGAALAAGKPSAAPKPSAAATAPAGPAAGAPNLAMPPALPASALPSVPRDAQTGLYGVDQRQLAIIAQKVRAAYGTELLDLAAIGSRVRGKASGMKEGRPVHARSDLDLVPLVRGSAPPTDAQKGLAQELEQLLGFKVEVHTVISFDGRPFGGEVPFYGAGGESYIHIGEGAALIPLGPAAAQKPAETPQKQEPPSAEGGFREFYY